MVIALFWPFGASAKPWKEAEKIARAGLAKEGLTDFKIEHAVGMPPDCFIIDTKDDRTLRVVYKGALLQVGGGLDAFAHYAKEVNLIDMQDLNVFALLLLLKQFGALPSTESNEYKNPSLDRANGEWRYHIEQFESEEQGMLPDRPKTHNLDHFTLTLTKDYRASWSQKVEAVPIPGR